MRNIQRIRTMMLGLIGLGLVSWWGCGPSSLVGGVYGPYDDGSTVTITEDGAVVQPSNCTSAVTGCVPGATSTDVCPGSKGPADILVKDGKVVIAVCYPAVDEEGGKRIVTLDEIKDVKSNGGRVTFDPAGDGKIYDDDLKVEGNGNVIYGNGAGNTIIGGKAELKGNNNRVRGVTVLGDVKFEGNNVSIVLSVVEGNLTIKGNNAIVADVVVLGDLKIEGNNHVLMRVFVAGKVDIKGDNNQCLESYYFNDKDANKRWDKGEQGDSWLCK